MRYNGTKTGNFWNKLLLEIWNVASSRSGGKARIDEQEAGYKNDPLNYPSALTPLSFENISIMHPFSSHPLL